MVIYFKFKTLYSKFTNVYVNFSFRTCRDILIPETMINKIDMGVNRYESTKPIIYT